MTQSLIVITGISGSGKTTALKALEDWGCEAIDNLPISLCPLLIQEKQIRNSLALGIDVRTRDFEPHIFLESWEAMRACTPRAHLIFFEAEVHALEIRYRESRRQHPLGLNMSIGSLIQKEKDLLSSLRSHADEIVDTTFLSPPEMKNMLQNRLGFFVPHKPLIYLLSFSYRRGVPSQADYVFDMRFLPNPHYHPEMKLLTGQSQEILDYLSVTPSFCSFMFLFEKLTLELALNEKRPSFVFAFGCTGGRHRSVFTAQAALAFFEKQGYPCQLIHRDLA